MIKGILQDAWWLSTFLYIPLLCAYILCFLLAHSKSPSLDLLLPFGSMRIHGVQQDQGQSNRLSTSALHWEVESLLI